MVQLRACCITFFVAVVLWVGPAFAVDKAAYEATYLQASDLPGFELGEDKKYDPSLSPMAFSTHKGEHTGFVLWGHTDESIAVILDDSRFAFTTAAAASAFMRDGATEISRGHPTISDAEKFGEESVTFGGPGTLNKQQVLERIVLFRVGTVVAKVVLLRQADAKNTGAMLSIFAGKAHKRMVAALGSSTGRTPVMPSPAPTEEAELTLPVSGWKIRVPGTWQVARDDSDKANHPDADRLIRVAPGPEIGAQLSLYEDVPDCSRIMSTLKEGTPTSSWISTGVSGYYDKGIERENGKASTHCAKMNRGIMMVIVVPSLRKSAELRDLMAKLLGAAGVSRAPSTVVTPPTRPSPSPNPSPSFGGDDGTFGDDFMFPHIAGLRVQVDAAYLIPADARETAFGFQVGLDGGFTTGRVIGLTTDFGLSLGYDFDGNVPFDGHIGIGAALGLGPVSIAPLIGLGGDTRGGADDEAIAHTMDAAFYWYPGGRLRLVFFPIAIEGYAAAPFRGSIEADQATDISNLVRVVARVAYYDDEALEYYAGFRYTRYIGATDDSGNELYPSAEQFGGVLGVGFTMLDEIDD